MFKFLTIFFSLISSTILFANTPLVQPIKHQLNGLVVIELKLHSDLPAYLFLLDTGSNVNFLNPDVARQLNDKNLFQFKEELNSNVTTYNSVIKSLGGTLSFNLDKFNFSQMPTNIMQNKRFQKELDGFDCCDGILGAPFLKQYPFLIDLDKNTFTLDVKKNKDLKYSLKFDLKGKDVIVIKCDQNKNHFSLRLDTGSEMPLTFHSNFVQKNRIFEKIYEINNVFAPSFVQFNKAFCGKLEIETEAYLYTGKTGALSHEDIAGNIGPKVLGQKYLIDYNAKKIYFAESKTPIDLSGVLGIKVDLFRNIGAKDILDRFEFLVLKSCTEMDKSSENCFSRWCEMRDIKNCPIPASQKLEDMILAFHGKNFDPHCAYPQVIDMYTNASEILQPHPCQWKKYLAQKKLNRTTNLDTNSFINPFPHEIHTEASRTVNQEQFTQNFYCYGIKENLFKKAELPPALFSLSIKGISFSKKAYEQYTTWLKTNRDGKSCAEDLKSFFNADDIQNYTFEKNKTHALVINEITLLGDGAGPKGGNAKSGLNDKLYENFLITLNHERLHLLFATMPELKKLIADKVNSLTRDELEAFMKEHPSYNFAERDVLLREYFSYKYEKNINKLLEDYPMLKK